MKKNMYKGKCTNDGKWISGYLFGSWNDTYILWGTCNDIPCMREVIPITVCQYIGMDDKNKKEIYENDIVKSDSNKIGKIIFHEDHMAYMVSYFKENNEMEYEYLYSTYNSKLEVIGNTIDNPEMFTRPETIDPDDGEIKVKKDYFTKSVERMTKSTVKIHLSGYDKLR